MRKITKQTPMAIGSASIVYVIAESGTGKTFSGDYLDVVHGFAHVDGDTPLKNVHLPTENYREVMKNVFTAMAIAQRTEKIEDQKEDYLRHEELWGPLYNEMARLTLEAAKDHDKVVFTHATHYKPERDHYIDKLVEGGVPRKNITLVQLTIDKDVKYRGLYYRTLVGLEEAGLSMEDVCRSWGWEFEGEMTPDKFVKCSKKFTSYFKQSEQVYDDCADAKKVDVSGRDVTHLDRLDAALGLSRAPDWSYEQICDEVKPIDERRNRDYATNRIGDILQEIYAEVGRELNPDVATDEGEAKIELEETRKRSSSIHLAELINDRQFSSSSVQDEKARALRSSLISQGKLDLDFEE